MADMLDEPTVIEPAHPAAPTAHRPGPPIGGNRPLRVAAERGVDADVIARALMAVHATPAVRTERVSALRQRIAAGVYIIPDAVLAHKLLAFRG